MVNEAVEWKRIHKTYDKREWLLVESHPASDAENVFCREVRNGYLGHAHVIPRAQLTETRKARVQVSDRRLMERINDAEE